MNHFLLTLRVDTFIRINLNIKTSVTQVRLENLYRLIVTCNTNWHAHIYMHDRTVQVVLHDYSINEKSVPSFVLSFMLN